MTSNLYSRFKEHNTGWVTATKHYRPFRLVHVELAKNRQRARRLEKFFKSGYGREIIKEIGKDL